jgi:probable rRNA maturation factor
MKGDLTLINRQRYKRIDTSYLKKIIREFLENILNLCAYDLSIQLVSASAMTQLNNDALGHAGSTDVITFDYSGGTPVSLLAGELFICVEEAVNQSLVFHTHWYDEIIRYCVHGILHILGYDDLAPVPRKKMKQVENRLVSRLAKEFTLSKLQMKTRVRR